MKLNKFNKVISMLLVLILIFSVGLTGCGSKETNTEAGIPVSEKDTSMSDDKKSDVTTEDETVVVEPITLTMQVYSKVNADYYEAVNLAEMYKQVKPHVTIEIIRSKDGEQMAQDIKIKKAADELPDIMGIRKEWMINLQEDLVPLNDLECVKKSPMSEKNNIDGDILATSNTYFTEFVFYSKSIFAEYDIEVPTTWDEFVAAAVKIRDGGKYIPILLGAKDTWPLYPYNEQMPVTVSGDGYYFSEMATQDRPFAEGTGNYDSHLKIQELFDADVFGPDPLGMGWDQVKVMFGSQGAMMAAGQWFLGDAKSVVEDESDIGVFFLPTRDSVDEVQNYLVLGGEGGLAISNKSENIDEAKAFIEWYNSEAFLPGLAKASSNFCIFDEYGVTLDPVFDEAFENIELNKVVLDTGNEAYVKLRDAVQYNATKVGQEMLAGKHFTEIFDNLNDQWEKAKSE